MGNLIRNGSMFDLVGVSGQWNPLAAAWDWPVVFQYSDGTTHPPPQHTICDGGYHTNATTYSGTCTECPPGTAEQHKGARFQCTKCAKGYYAPGSRTLACIGCEPGKFAQQTRSTFCQDCPIGATCPLGNQIDVLSGFWRASLSSLIVLECPTPLAFVGGNGTDLCAKPYTGPLCHFKGWRGSRGANNFQRCQALNYSSSGILAGVLVVFVAISYILYKRFNSHHSVLYFKQHVKIAKMVRWHAQCSNC